MLCLRGPASRELTWMKLLRYSRDMPSDQQQSQGQKIGITHPSGRGSSCRVQAGRRWVTSLYFSAALLLFVVTARPLQAATGLNVREGQKAPDFSLPDQHGDAVRLTDQRGKWVVLYFYPKDDTPGCTKEACSFRDNIVGIQQLNATVLGVSVDSVLSHEKFAKKHRLNFQILSDNQFQVTKEYGVLTRFMGESYARRSTVVIDPKGTIRKIFPSVRPENHAIEIHRTLEALQK